MEPIKPIIDKIKLAMPDDVRARLEAQGIGTSPTPQRLSALRESAESCSLCHDTGYLMGIGVPGRRTLVMCECQRDRRIEQYRKDSNIPAIYRDARLPNFDATLYGSAGGDQRKSADRTREMAARYVTNYDRIKANTGGRGLYLTSRTKGSGKTLLACIIANELIDRGTRSVRGHGADAGGHQGQLRPRGGESEAQIIGTATSAPVLILDDVGVERPTGWVCETLYRLMDARLANARPTIFTSNVPVDELKYDERIIDRIRRMAFVIELPEVGVRSKLAAVEDMRMRAMLGGGT